MLTIQQKQRDDGVLPYPFHLDADGAVLRQDFWRGRVARLVGFCADPEVHWIDLDCKDFLADPQRAVGMHPVMEDAEGKLSTYVGPVERVTQSEDE